MTRYLPIALCLMLLACGKELEPISELEAINIPEGFPQISFPVDNEYSFERWSLGKKLFYDPILSRDSTVSCSTCHMQKNAFTDGLKTAKGIDGIIGRRNSPSLSNVAYHPYLTREGGIATLEQQVLVPIQEHDEFDFNIVLIAERLNNSNEYIEMSRNAYQRDPEPYVITRALANFERSLISGNSSYDKFLRGEDSLTDSESRGLTLFNSSKLNCSACHSGFDFTDYGFRNNGLYENYTDPGRFRLTDDSLDLALFKIPSLRNVELTAPYMHDGSLKDLKEVIHHYASGGLEHINKSDLIKGFEISEQETDDLINFLKSLTDYEFIDNPNFKE